MRPFSINIPVFNEEPILVPNTEKLVQLLNRLKTEYEIIIVSNGSTDQSNEIGQQLTQKFPQIRFFSLPKPGVGRAFKKAVQEARFEHIISLDIDLSVDLAFIEEANTLLNSYTMVIGSKIAGSQKRGLIRKIGSGSYIALAKLLLGMNLHDFSIGAKGFRKSFVLKHMNQIDDYTSYVLNLAYQAKKNGEKMVEIPIHCEDHRKSKFNLLAEGIYRFTTLFKLSLSRK